MSTKVMAEYFIVSLPYVMAGVFALGAFFRYMTWYTVKRHEWFARQFELRVGRFIEGEVPGTSPQASFYVLVKRLLERTYYESFAVRDRLKRRRGDGVMGLSDRVFLVKPGAAWMVKDILNQLKFLKWTKDTPKLHHITRATFHHNPCFNRVFGIFPVAGVNDLVNILPGLFVVAGILGTFVGIAGGLQELGGMNIQDLDNTKNIMDRFLQEISFAMKTSIAGIIFSLLAHVFSTIFSPDRVYVMMADRFDASFDLLWYRADNNAYPSNGQSFDEHRDPVESLASDAVNGEVQRVPKSRVIASA